MAFDSDIIGLIIDDRYEILKKIDRGGMATVYLAQDRKLERKVAIKIMHPHLTEGEDGQDFLRRFESEAKLAAQINDPGIVSIYDQGQIQGQKYIVMEYIEGINLRELLSKRSTFDDEATLRCIMALLKALISAHEKGLVHRDLKPENILIDYKGNVHITDFGLAKALTEAKHTQTGTILGTVAYVAPEIVEHGNVSEQSDIYALGVLMYELLTGKPPFSGKTPVQTAFMHVNHQLPSLKSLDPNFPEPIAEVVETLTSKDLSVRPKTTKEAYNLLKNAKSHLTETELKFQFHPDNSRENSEENSSKNLSGNSSKNTLVSSSNATPNDSSETNANDSSNFPSDKNLNRQNPSSRKFFSRNTSDNPKDKSKKNLKNSNSPTQDNPKSDLEKTKKSIHYQDDQVFTQLVKSGKKSHKGLITGIIVAVVLIALGLLTYYYLFLAHLKTVPDLTNLSKDEAISILEENSIPYILEDAYSESILPDFVVSTNPNAGETIDIETQTLIVGISIGKHIVAFPDGINGMNIIEATKVLTDQGFIVSTESEYNDDIEKDFVIFASFDPGQEVSYGSEVILKVSQGPEPIILPNLLGLSEDESTQSLDDLGLKYSLSYDYSDEVNSGLVMSQKPDGSSTVYKGDEIELVISLGPPVVEMPYLIGMSIDEAHETLTNLGLYYKDDGDVILGLVQTQSESAGTEVRIGSTITLGVV